MRCRECGLEVDNDKAFCPVCGAPMKVTADYEYIQAEIANKVDRFFNDEHPDSSGTAHEKPFQGAGLVRQAEENVTKTRNIYGTDSIFDEDPSSDLDYEYEDPVPRDYEEPENLDFNEDEPYDEPYQPEERPRRSPSYHRVLVPYQEKDRTAAKVITGLVIFLIIAAAAVGVMAILGVFSDKDQSGGNGVTQTVSTLSTNIEAGGTYQLPLEISITNATEGNVFYTLDGMEPTSVSRIYTGPFTINALDVANSYPTVHLRAVSFGEDSEKSGEINIEFNLEYNEADAALIAEQQTQAAEPETTQAVAPSAPRVSPTSGSYSEDTQILVSAPDGGDIFYTYDGTRPTSASTLYTGPVMMMPGTQTFSAICIKDGLESEVTSNSYTLEYPYPYSADEAMNQVTNELLWDGYIIDYDLYTYNGYVQLTHQGVHEIDGYTYYIIKVDFYTSDGVLDNTEYRGVGVNYGNVYGIGQDNGTYYVRW